MLRLTSRHCLSMAPFMSTCSSCYEANCCAPGACNKFLADPGAERQTNGYGPAVAQAAPAVVHCSTQDIDGIVKPRATTVLATLTAEETALLATGPNFAGLDIGDLPAAVTLVGKRPGQNDVLYPKVLALAGAQTTQALIAKVEFFVGQMKEAHTKAVNTVAPITQSSSYMASAFPLYNLFCTLVKAVVRSQDAAEVVDQKSLFDPSTGKTLVPFEKVTKCQTPGHLFRAFAMFKETVTILLKLAPKVWTEFESRVYHTEAAMGHLLTQQFIGEVLRKLDQGAYPNIVALMRAGEHNRIIDDLRPPLKAIKEPNVTGKNNRTRLTPGPVTKQGEFASCITDKDGKPLACHNFKAKNPCTFGVMAGQGHDSHIGKCAYHHA